MGRSSSFLSGDLLLLLLVHRDSSDPPRRAVRRLVGKARGVVGRRAHPAALHPKGLHAAQVELLDHHRGEGRGRLIDEQIAEWGGARFEIGGENPKKTQI